MSPSPENRVAHCVCLTDSVGNFVLELAWESPSIEGGFDLWVDVNQDGIYNLDADLYHYQSIEISALMIIPEIKNSLILMILMMVAIIVVAASRKNC